MQKLNRRGLLFVVALASGLGGAMIFSAPGEPAKTSAAPAVIIVQEQPYPPGFEQPHRPTPLISFQEYPQEDGYAPGFEQRHRPIPAWSVQEQPYPPGFEQPHH